MSIAKVIEITASSTEGFEDAIRQGVARAAETLYGMEGARVKEQSVVIAGDRVAEYKVTMALSFKLE